MRPTLRLAGMSLLLAVLSACGEGEGAQSGPPRSKAFPVEVETVVGREVQYAVSAVGSIEAFEEIQITARVQGAVDKVHFREGQDVTPQTVLVEIEPARFQYALDAAQAAYDRASAELKEAQDGLKRREDPKGGIFSKEEVEAWRTKVAVATAVERERAAELSQARLDFANATPRAPLSGVIQSRLVQTGQWVTPGTVIARLLRRDPMLLRFAVPEDQSGQLHPGLGASFSVTGAKQEYRATLTHVAAAADPATRMVPVVAEVAAEHSGVLTPGTFIRVSVPVGSRADAPTVPETAVRASEHGFMVYVVEGGKAHQRIIEIGLRTPDGRIEVRSGLEVGQVIVTRGAEALREGAEVKVATAGGEQPPEGARP